MQQRTNGQLRTTGQWIRHLDRRMNHLEEWILPLTASKHRPGVRKKFEGWHERAVKSIAALGLDQRQIEILKQYGLLAVDNVTGYAEARSGHARFETLNAAIQHVIETGEGAFYLEIDLSNLSGMNAKLGHSGANEIFKRIAGILQIFLSGAGEDAVFFRHGGDEISAIVVASTEAQLTVAIDTITQAVDELSEQFGLQHLPHPKHPGDSRFFGIGVHFGMVQIQPEHASNPQVIFQEADMQLEGNKKIPAA